MEDENELSEPYAGPAIQEVLPPELFTKIFQCLESGSLYSCMRTCRYMKNVIYARRKLLPKGCMTLQIERKSESMISLRISKTSMHAPRRDWLCHLKKRDTSCPSSSERGTAQKIMSVAEFYDSHGLSGLKWNSANKSQTFVTDNIMDLFKEFLDFLMIRCDLTSLFAFNLLPADMEVVSNSIKDNCCSITHLQMDTDHPVGPEANLILDVASTQSVSLGFTEPTYFSPDIFKSSTVLNAATVIISVENRNFGPRAARPYETFEITNEMLLSLKADDIQILNGFTRIDVFGLRAFLEEWNSGKRDINSIEILFKHEPLDFSYLIQGFKHVIKASPSDPAERAYILIRRPSGQVIKLMRNSSDIITFKEVIDEDLDDDAFTEEMEFDSEPEGSDHEQAPEEDEEMDREPHFLPDGEANMLRQIVRDYDYI